MIECAYEVQPKLRIIIKSNYLAVDVRVCMSASSYNVGILVYNYAIYSISFRLSSSFKQINKAV